MTANADKADELATKLQHTAMKVTNLRKRKLDLENQVTSLENALNAEKERFNSSTYYDLLSKASEIPSAIFKSYGQTVRKCHDDDDGEKVIVLKCKSLLSLCSVTAEKHTNI